MKSDKNILIAFILNLSFSLFEFIGGFFTGSVAITSDALHDLGDAASIGISYFMERKSQKGADDKYTFGYGRYSVLGGWITSMVLLVGSMVVIYNAVTRLRNPVEVDYAGMMMFAVIGITVNFIAAYVTRDGRSVNQKSVNLHMIEDVLGWIAVLVGAIVMRFTDWWFIDPILSILVALTIWVGAISNLIEITNILCEKTPRDINMELLKSKIAYNDNVSELTALKIWNINSDDAYAIVHITTNSPKEAKDAIRKILAEHNITQSTIECSDKDEITPVFKASHPRNCSCGHHHHHFPKMPFKK